MEEERLEVEINRIKEVLDKKIPQEEIEKKLKEKANDEQNSKKEEVSNIGNGIKIVPKKSTRAINIIIYLFSFLALILLVFAIYLFSTKNTTSSESSNNIKVKEITNLVVKEKIVPKIVTKIVDLDNSNFKQYYNNLEFKSLKCYDFKVAQTQVSKECANKIDTFFKENSKSVRFEIIPVVSSEDNTLYKKIESNIENFDNKLKVKIKDYLLFGLSKQRVLETTFYIKGKFGEDLIIIPTNYYVTSKKSNRGIIIKAYYKK